MEFYNYLDHRSTTVSLLSNRLRVDFFREKSHTYIKALKALNSSAVLSTVEMFPASVWMEFKSSAQWMNSAGWTDLQRIIQRLHLLQRPSHWCFSQSDTKINQMLKIDISLIIFLDIYFIFSITWFSCDHLVFSFSAHWQISWLEIMINSNERVIHLC